MPFNRAGEAFVVERILFSFSSSLVPPHSSVSPPKLASVAVCIYIARVPNERLRQARQIGTLIRFCRGIMGKLGGFKVDGLLLGIYSLNAETCARCTSGLMYNIHIHLCLCAQTYIICSKITHYVIIIYSSIIYYTIIFTLSSHFCKIDSALEHIIKALIFMISLVA